MNVLLIADDEFAALKAPACSADLLISLGDMPDAVIQQVGTRCGCKEILAVKGNHDSSSPFPPPIRDLHLQTFAFRGVTFGGFCGSWKYKPRGNYLFEQDEVERLLASFPPVDVFVTHNSPRLVHDRDDEVHLGFVAFSNYLARHRPKYFLHGHQHHDVETTIGNTRIIGTFGHRFLRLEAIASDT
jgi:Icc-related predicted phosphoesterase